MKKVSAMKRVLLTITTIIALSLPLSEATAQSSLSSHAFAPADPCGFRSFVWPQVQWTSRILTEVPKDSLGQDNQKLYSADMTFDGSYIRDFVRDVAGDYGRPTGWKPLVDQLSTIFANLHDALAKWEDFQAQTGGGGPVGIRIYKPVSLSPASQAMQQAWTTIKSLCARGGKSAAASAWVASHYASGNWTPPAFNVPSHWILIYHYDCTGLRDYSDGNNGSDPFSITLEDANHGFIATLVSTIGRTAWGSQRMSRAGRFTLKVTSDCYWHFRVNPSW